MYICTYDNIFLPCTLSVYFFSSMSFCFYHLFLFVLYFIYFVIFFVAFVLVAALALLENKRQKQHAPNVFTHDLAKAKPAHTHTLAHSHTCALLVLWQCQRIVVVPAWRWRLSQGHFSCAECDIC